MADYREISQTYAQGAIKSVILVNGGAAIAILSQFTSLLAHPGVSVISFSILFFVFGVTAGMFAWLVALFVMGCAAIAFNLEIPSQQ